MGAPGEGDFPPPQHGWGADPPSLELVEGTKSARESRFAAMLSIPSLPQFPPLQEKANNPQTT